MKMRSGYLFGTSVLSEIQVLLASLLLLGTAPAVAGQSLQVASAEFFGTSIREGRSLLYYAPKDIDEKNRAALNKVINLHLDSVQMEEALQYIADQADLRLSYSIDVSLLNWDEPVTLELHEATILGALYAVLKQRDLRLKITPRGLLIVHKDEEADVDRNLPIAEALQQQVVTGMVSDASTGEPLPGVNILIAGTDRGTVTDQDGNYDLSVPDLNASLIFSYIGYEPQTIGLAGRSVVNVRMVPRTIEGQEMIVTAFGIERESRSLTYSTQNVATQQLPEARELNVLSSLTGRVAGLSITQASGGLGAETRVILRGNRSISGDSQPLYVIDGVPVRGNPSDLSPDDIESINVLKGPNAAALYGSEAQNGAIVINTKRAERGVVNVSWNSNFTLLDPMVLVEYQNEYGQGSGGVYDRTAETSWGPRMDGQTVRHWSPDPVRANETYAFLPQPSIVEDIYQTGYNASSNISAAIGGDNSQTLFSYTFTDAEGILETNQLQRHNVLLRFSSQISEKLNLDSRLSYMRQNLESPISTGAIRNIEKIPRNISIQQVREYEYVDANGQVRQHYWLPGSNGGRNPFWDMYRRPSESIRERVMAMASLTYNFTESVSLMVRSSYDGTANNNENRIWNDDFSRGQYSISFGNSLEWNGDVLLAYRENFENWSLQANIGGSLKQQRNKGLNSNTGRELLIPNFFTLTNSIAPVTEQNLGLPSDVQSLYAFAQIGWQDAIYLDLTARNDWSSTLPANSRTYFYPSVGLTTVLSDLIPAFPDFFTYASVRASYAQVGNSAPVYAIHRVAEIAPGGRGGFLQLERDMPNEQLRPERTESVEVGLDIRFLEGRLGLDLTFYNMNTRDQLFTVALPASSGASRLFTNGGDVRNRGIEAMVRTRPIQSANLGWDLDFHFGLNRNMVVKISDERPRLAISATTNLRDVIVEEGQPFGQIYGTGFMRDDQGRVIVQNNGIPRITPGKDVLVANFEPDWTGGISSQVNYRNWSFGVLIDHRQGGSLVSGKKAELQEAGVTKETLQGRDGTQLIFGQNFFAHETSVLDDGTPNTVPLDPEAFWRSVGGINSPAAEPFVESATNTRLRELTIGYYLPPSILSSLPVSAVKISLVGRNLFFFYRESNYVDPEILAGTGPQHEGTSAIGAPPPTRSIGLNLNVNF